VIPDPQLALLDIEAAHEVLEQGGLARAREPEDDHGLAAVDVEVDRREPDEVRPLVAEALRRVFLPADEIMNLRPADLSGGMRKRVGLARAIIREPRLLLYDEPTTGLDPVTVSGVNLLVRNLQERLGVTSIVITHDLDSAFTIGDRVAMLYKGRIIACAPPDELRQIEHPVLQQLLKGEVRGPLTEDYVD
jgi:phospholipid/cholesterol/gamma-HCH transport system ATP-binding protein